MPSNKSQWQKSVITKGEDISTTIARDMQLQIRDWVKVYERYYEVTADERKRFLESAAEPLVEELRNRAPVGDKVHYVYSKQIDGAGNYRRSRKGEGRIKYRYNPGNLRNSFGVLDLRRTVAVIVGARVRKKSGAATKMKGGRFGIKRGDGFYLHFLEYGTRYKDAEPFVRPAIIVATPKIIRTLRSELMLLAKRFGRRYQITTTWQQ